MVETALKTILLITISIATIVFLIYLVWQHTPEYCYTDLNTTANLILMNLNKCVELCWKRHNFGEDTTVDDCYSITIWINDRPIEKDELEKLSENVKVYWNDDLEPKFNYNIKIRYNYTGKEISLIV